MEEYGLPLPDDELDELLGNSSSGGYAAPSQEGHYVKHYDKEMRCASKGCSSPTYYKLCGVPRCWPHIVWELDKMVMEVAGPFLVMEASNNTIGSVHIPELSRSADESALGALDGSIEEVWIP